MQRKRVQEKGAYIIYIRIYIHTYTHMCVCVSLHRRGEIGGRDEAR